MNRGIQKMGAFLVDLLKLDQPGKGKPELQQELSVLSVGSRTAVRDYYIRKITVLAGCLAAGVILTVVCYFVYDGVSGTARMQTLGRPGYGEGDRKEELTVQIEGQEEAEQLEVTVQERKYTDQEKTELLDAALEELEPILIGTNESLDEVRSSLVFPQSMEDGAVTLSWMTVPYGVVGDDGFILAADNEDGTLVELQAILTCSGEEAVYTAYAKVYPPQVSGREQILRSVRKAVELADAQESYSAELRLPDSADGRALIWLDVTENPFSAVLAISLLATVCVYLEMDSEVHKRAQKRKDQLLLDYPDLMWRMTMLLGAGMSIKGAFTRISEEYRREQETENRQHRKRGALKIRYVYEEVARTCHEMQSGIPEAQAYERFGKRCQLPEYIRIGSVLSQNLKKGAKGLTKLLETEAEASLNDRKNHAREIGEKAGTKLLLPMVMMLGVVLVVLMVPAFLSF